ncbi:SCO family protein [Pseudomonas citronellolis]|uniref:SCO family protein n=1 Tax=Pseudomonas citronellolis TaxID=53408 RepID=UPI0023E42AFF|nr:SCO family protein [Pseudomonas citronellolis]MDF3935211.1 SCO family protein [Pseudomonas citronellolis]
MNLKPVVFAFSLLACATAGAHSTGEHAGHAEPARHSETSQVAFVDQPLLDQDGRSVDLRRDLVGERIVVMGFVYTSCTTVCPLVSSIMGKLQARLGDQVGREVSLVSISVDPQRDTPQRLLDYSRRYHAGPGWRWLTGEPVAVDDTLKALGAWSADYESHPPLIMVGDGRSDRWTRFYGFTDPAVLQAKVAELQAARASAEHDHAGHLAAEVRP